MRDIVSEGVHRRAGLPPDSLPQQEVTLRGRNEAIQIRGVARSTALARLLERHPMPIAS